ncbi:hypothetical protein EDF60_1343 [Leucobacter luti]|uniref:hypothetical protein n=1 Tax=Leucobacter luti TaxID=340320 RepID=UPI001050C725|nr:hypothetical protein [Leucobacter luti]MCW2287739.1 hypothetical protein [Leucobacter luti]TCK46096.1 hypothetical protein EDF60_1343 [Leucobacter luti]
MLTTSRPLKVTLVLLATGSFAACSAADAQPAQESGSEASQTVIGTWDSDSTKGVQIFVKEDSGFGVSGEGCAASGNWHDEAGTTVVVISSLPGVAGCPETMTLDLGSIKSIEVSSQGKLIARDSSGHEESFSLNE